MSGRFESRQGLTMIEVLLAVAILGLSFGVLLTSVVRCLAVMKSATTLQESLWTLGRGEAEFPPLRSDDVEDLAVDDETYENGVTFSRRVDEDDDEDELFKLYSTVSWEARGREYVEEFVRYVYYPEDQ